MRELYNSSFKKILLKVKTGTNLTFFSFVFLLLEGSTLNFVKIKFNRKKLLHSFKTKQKPLFIQKTDHL